MKLVRRLCLLFILCCSLGFFGLNFEGPTYADDEFFELENTCSATCDRNNDACNSRCGDQNTPAGQSCRSKCMDDWIACDNKCR
jgi:hypothetical protein